MRTIRGILAVAVCFLWVQSSLAQITKISGGGYDNGVIPNTVTNDLSIDFSGQYTGSQLLIELTAGSIYQDALGSNSPPSPVFIPLFPTVAFDSFFAQGSVTSGGPYGDPAILMGSGALNLGGSLFPNFDTTGANLMYGPLLGTHIFDEADFLTARFTLSDDAQGTWSYMASANAEFGVVEAAPIIDGKMTLAFEGDFDSDDNVGQGDLNEVLLNWGNTTPWSNGPVGQEELSQVLLGWGNSPESWAIEPEQIIPPGAGGSGDYDQSGTITQGDLDILLLNWGTTTPGFGLGLTPPVDQDDWDRLAFDWPNSFPLSSSIPEPSNLALLLLACAWCASKRVS